MYSTKLALPCQNLNQFHLLTKLQIYRFNLAAVISDDSGGIEIKLLDREVRTLLGKTVFDIDTEVNLQS